MEALYLLSLLNSSLFEAYARRVFVDKQNGWYEVQPEGLEAFPIQLSLPPEQKALEGLVDRILKAKGADAEADVSALEREIDERVYRLYGLTKERSGSWRMENDLHGHKPERRLLQQSPIASEAQETDAMTQQTEAMKSGDKNANT